MLFRLAGALQPSSEEAAGTSGNSGTLLMSGKGLKNIITNDLLDDPLLSVDNMRYFQKISKEMYRFTLVRHDCSSSLCFVKLFCLLSLPSCTGCGQTLSRKFEKLKAVESGLQELQAKDQRIKEELRKNIYLRKELDKLKQ
jgi:hypothetical protein